mmetsp:Transcript_10290/g.34057  ORF Transcript_10290/g.34057 Transcript_10290/m.34057 type:complete len:245 (-) Transcript_10290:1086-1820(-)
MSSAVISSEKEPSTTRMRDASKASQYVIFELDPVVSSCDSSGCQATLVKMLDSNRASLRTRECRSKLRHEPSAEAETAIEPSALTFSALTTARCSLMLKSMAWWDEVTRQPRMRPSRPPESSVQALQGASLGTAASAVTPSVCASLMTNLSLPDSGRKERIRPSDQPVTISPPSSVVSTASHSKFGTRIRSSSDCFLAFQTRTSPPEEHVTKTSEKLAGKTTSFTFPTCAVATRSACQESTATR